MTTMSSYRVGEIIRWAARLWSIPLVAVTFLLAAGPFVRLPFNLGNLLISFSSLSAMAFAVALVVAWHWERVGGWIGVGSGVAFIVWFTIRSRHLAFGPFDLLFWTPVALFLVSASLHRTIETTRGAEPDAGGTSTPQTKPRRFFALPSTELGWWSLLIGTGFFVFMRLFWMQANAPGRDHSTFFSDPINAACLIGAFISPIVGLVMSLAAIIWQRERSIFLVPLLLLGFFALLWALAVMSGANV